VPVTATCALAATRAEAAQREMLLVELSCGERSLAIDLTRRFDGSVNYRFK